MKLDKFLEMHKLINDPFAYTNAEEEDLLSEYFVPPPYFNSVRGMSTQPKSTIVFAPRGGGKTAQRRVLEEDSKNLESEYLCVLYDQFPSRSTPTLGEHLNEINARIFLGILIALEDENLSGLAFDKNNRSFLAGEAAHLDALGVEKFQDLIKTMKSEPRRVGDWLRNHSGPIKVIISSVLNKKGIKLDPISPWGPQIASFPETSNIDRLKRLISIAQFVKYQSVYILIDRLDETPSTSTDPKKSINLISELVLNLSVMEMPGLAIKVFAWDLSRDRYHDLGGRSDRIKEFQLTWPLDSLAKMMSKRLAAYSRKQVDSLNDLCDETLNFDFHKLACYLAHGSPRDMIRFCDHVVAEHLNKSVESAALTEADIWQGARKFSEEISLERCSKYLPDLMRLNNYRFTQAEVANKYLKITKQATQAKVSEWRKTSMVTKVTEVADFRARPQHLYGVSDPRLAIHVRPGTDCQEVLEFFSFECLNCLTINFSDAPDPLTCQNCQQILTTTETPSIMQQCTL